jgi:hypothetical protein
MRWASRIMNHVATHGNVPADRRSLETLTQLKSACGNPVTL